MKKKIVIDVMNLTKAVVRRGQDHAVFPLHLPRWTDRASIIAPCLGKPRKFSSFVSAPREITLSCKFSLTHQTSFHSFNLKGRKAEDEAQKPAGFARRLQVHLEAAGREKFPSFQTRPVITYDEDLAGGGAMMLSLPPRSALYSTNENLFEALGFPDGLVQSASAQVPTGTSGKMVVAQVYGLWNLQDENVIIYTDPFTPTEMLSERFKAWQIVMPINFRMQVEYLDWPPFLIVAPDPVREEPGEIMQALEELCQTASARFQLRTNPINIATTAAAGPTQLLLSCSGQAGAAVNFVMSFDDDSCQVFGLQPNHELSFSLNTSRTQILTLKSGTRRDPFLGLYPITLLSVGSGMAQSWVEGLGFVPVLGIVEDEKKPIFSEGVVFETDLCSLRLEFFDFALRKITFQDDFFFFLTMDFKQIKPKPDVPERKKRKESLDPDWNV